MSASKSSPKGKPRRDRFRAELAGQGVTAAGGETAERATLAAGSRLIHDIGNSISAAGLHMHALAGSALSADQQTHVLAALGEVRATGRQLLTLRRICADMTEGEQRRARRGTGAGGGSEGRT
jgi:hypothetical protein